MRASGPIACSTAEDRVSGENSDRRTLRMFMYMGIANRQNSTAAEAFGPIVEAADVGNTHKIKKKAKTKTRREKADVSGMYRTGEGGKVSPFTPEDCGLDTKGAGIPS